MTGLEVFAPVDSTTGVFIYFGTLGAVVVAALAIRWITNRAKRNDPTREVSTWEELTQPDWDADPEPNVRTRYMLADNDRPEYREVTRVRYSQCAFSEGYPAVVRSFDGEFYRGRIEEGYDTDDGFVLAGDALDRHIHGGTPMPARTLDRIVLSGTDVWDWLRSDPDELARVGDAAVTYDLDLADHHVYYVHPEQTVVRNVTAQVNAWLLRQAEIAEVGTIADVKANERHARMAQPEMTRRRPIGDDPNDEVTAPVEHASPRQHLARIAAAHERHLGMRPVVHAQARTYDLQGIGSVCSGCREEWPCDGSRVNGRPL